MSGMRTEEQIRAAIRLCEARRNGMKDGEAWIFYDNEAKVLLWALGETENWWLDGTVPLPGGQ